MMYPTVLKIIAIIFIILLLIRIGITVFKYKTRKTWYESKRELTFDKLINRTKENGKTVNFYEVNNELNNYLTYAIKNVKREQYLILKYNHIKNKKDLAIHVYNKREKLIYVYKHYDNTKNEFSPLIKLPKKALFVNITELKEENNVYDMPYNKTWLMALFDTSLYLLLVLSLYNQIMLMIAKNYAYDFTEEYGTSLFVSLLIITTAILYGLLFKKFNKRNLEARSL